MFLFVPSRIAVNTTFDGGKTLSTSAASPHWSAPGTRSYTPMSTLAPRMRFAPSRSNAPAIQAKFVPPSTARHGISR